MKKSLFLLFVLLASLVILTGCNKDKRLMNNILDDLQLGFSEGESLSIVKNNIVLPLSYGEDMIIIWESSDETTITSYGVVVRKQTDTAVTLTATMSSNDQEVTQDFRVTVLKYDPLLDDNGNEITDDVLLLLEIRDILRKSISATYLEDTIIHTPFEMYGASITWELDSEYLSNYQLGLTKIEMPFYFLEIIGLRATITKGTETVSMVTEIWIQDSAISTIKQLLDPQFIPEAFSSLYRTSGVVIGHFHLHEETSFLIQDDNSAIQVLSSSDEITNILIDYIGKEVELHLHPVFEIDPYFEFVFDDLSVLNVILINDSPTIADPVQLTLDSSTSDKIQFLNQKQTTLSNLTLVEIDSPRFDSGPLHLYFKNNEFGFRLLMVVPTAEHLTPEQLAIIMDLELGDSVQITSSFSLTENGVFHSVYASSTIIEKIDLTTDQLLDLSIDQVRVDKEFFHETHISFPDYSLSGTTISWSSSDPALVNPSTGEIKLLLYETASVTLTATFTIGNQEKTVDFPIVIGTPITPIIDLPVRSQAQFRVQGIITSGKMTTNFVTGEALFTIQEDFSGIVVVSTNSEITDLLNTNIGNKVEIRGTVANQKLFISSLELIDSSVETPKHINIDSVDLSHPTNINKYSGLLVELTSLYVLTAHANWNNTIYTIRFLHLSSRTFIEVSWDLRNAPNEATANIIKNITYGEFYNVNSSLLLGESVFNRDLSLSLSSETTIEKAVASSEDHLAVTLLFLDNAADLVVRWMPTTISDPSSFVLMAGSLGGVSITWESSDTSVINPNGSPVVTLPDSGSVIVLMTATLTLDGVEKTVYVFFVVHSQ